MTHKTADPQDVAHCVQCGKDAPPDARGWEALDETAVVMLCPRCRREVDA